MTKNNLLRICRKLFSLKKNFYRILENLKKPGKKSRKAREYEEKSWWKEEQVEHIETNQQKVKKSKRIWRKVVVKGRTGWTYRDKPAKSQEKVQIQGNFGGTMQLGDFFQQNPEKILMSSPPISRRLVFVMYSGIFFFSC